MARASEATSPTGGPSADTRSREPLYSPKLGERLRAARLERGMTMAQLAAGDVSPSFVSLVELGKSRISLRVLTLLASRLQLPVSHFLDEPAVNADIADAALNRAQFDLQRGDVAGCLSRLEAIPGRGAQNVRALVLKGRALLASGRTRSAIAAFEQATEADDESDAMQTAELQFEFACVLAGLRSFDDALLPAKAALAAIERLPDYPALRADILLLLGDLVTATEGNTTALPVYERAADSVAQISILDGLPSVYGRLSDEAERAGDMEAASRFTRMGLAAFAAARDARRAADLPVTLAERLQKVGQWERAGALAERALAGSHAIAEPELEARCRMVLASVALQQGDLERARQEAEMVVELEAAHGNLANSAPMVLAEVAARKGDVDQAHAHYQQALSALAQLQDPIGHEQVATAYSRFLRDQGDIEGALEYALRAVDARAQNADPTE